MRIVFCSISTHPVRDPIRNPLSWSGSMEEEEKQAVVEITSMARNICLTVTWFLSPYSICLYKHGVQVHARQPGDEGPDHGSQVDQAQYWPVWWGCTLYNHIRRGLWPKTQNGFIPYGVTSFTWKVPWGHLPVWSSGRHLPGGQERKLQENCSTLGQDVEVVECLQGVDRDVFYYAAMNVSKENLGRGFAQLVDKDFAETPFNEMEPEASFASGKFAKVPLMIGFNKDGGIHRINY